MQFSQGEASLSSGETTSVRSQPLEDDIPSQIHNHSPLKHKNTHHGQASQGFMVQIVDKRSRSETPDKMSATHVLLRAHKKLQAQAEKRKQSPQKIMEKHNMRQKKAEELRLQIEQSKKNWYEKIRIRQQIAKKKWQELLAERKAKLQGKLEQAEERRESEIQTLVNKAKQEILKIDETNFIQKMAMNNMKLDLNMKMNDTQERRNQIMEEQIKRKQIERAQREEAAETRRLELQKQQESKILTNQQRREQADLRRIKMIEERRRLAQDSHKRLMVLQRKNDLGEKISDVMSFVNNSEFIWEFLGNEKDWQELGAFEGLSGDESMLFELMQKDQIEIEKLKLKRDADLLNQIIFEEEDGRIFSDKTLISKLRKRARKGFESPDQNSSDEDDEEQKYCDSVLTPERLRRLQDQSPQQKTTDEESKSLDGNMEYLSDGSDKDSIPEESTNQKSEKIFRAPQSPSQEEGFTDDVQNYMLYSQRLQMSMKRNILKKNLSEDLTWADFLKNEIYQQHQCSGLNSFKITQTRSLQSTPDKKHEVNSDIDEKSIEERIENIEKEDTISLKIKNKRHQSKKGKQKGHKNQVAINEQNLNQNTSSSSSVSDKSRLTSVVYPSKNKKTPKNQVDTKINQPQPSDPKLLMNNKKLANSNQGSTNSLNLHSQQSETPLSLSKKIQLQPEIDSARKRQGRLHSSSVQESSMSGVIQSFQMNSQLNQSMIQDESTATQYTDKIIEQNISSHTGTQMNQLIQNSKPLHAATKLIPKKFTANAIKLLFPIRQQVVLVKRGGKDGQFGKFKINIKMEDLSQVKLASQTLINQQTGQMNQNDSVDEKLQSQKSLTSSLQNQVNQSMSDLEKRETSTLKRSNQNTPQSSNRKESIDLTMKEASHSVASLQGANLSQEQQPVGTPNQSKLLQIQKNFWERQLNNLKSQSLQNEDSTSSLQKKQQALTQQNQAQSSAEVQQTTPKKERKFANINKNNSSEVDIYAEPNKQQEQSQMNETGYKELILKYLLTDNITLIKNDDSQKTISLDQSESDNRIFDFLEQNELTLRYCRLCDLILPDHSTNDSHIIMKSHKKTRDELGIKDSEDQQFSIVTIQSLPGDIEKELLKEKEKALKRKMKRLKTQMIAQAMSHEAASSCPGREYNSPNKKRLQILCIDMEKQVIPSINNYDALENTLKELIKILDMRKQADLHLIRKLKFIPILVEICKRISVCHKNEFKHIGKMLDYVIKIINIFCNLRENRNYMFSTNRMLVLVELLNWCLNRPTQLFYGINFISPLIQILTMHVKHRAPYECQQMKEYFLDYIICSPITMKIKGKFSIINGPLDLSEAMGQIPLFLLKSAAFIEALTNQISIDALSRPVYEKSSKIGDYVLFVIQNTELFGIIPMITTILLSRNQPFKPSQNFQQALPVRNKMIPQTLLSLAITSIKIVNNVLRMDYKAAQQMMSDFEIQEQLYHLFNYILFYTLETNDQEDCKELLHETLLLIGYFTLDNPKNQSILCKGENTLIQKLCNMPFTYFCDKKLKDILFPTLIQASYRNERCLAIMDQEMSIDLIVQFITQNLKEELPKIVEEKDEYHSISSLGGYGHGGIVRPRSPSQSSASSQCSLQMDMANGNSPFLPLYMRFHKKQWKDAIQFYSEGSS